MSQSLHIYPVNTVDKSTKKKILYVYSNGVENANNTAKDIIARLTSTYPNMEMFLLSNNNSHQLNSLTLAEMAKCHIIIFNVTLDKTEFLCQDTNQIIEHYAHNPCVLMELGYALGKFNPQNIIMVSGNESNQIKSLIDVHNISHYTYLLDDEIGVFNLFHKLKNHIDGLQKAKRKRANSI